MKKIRIEAMTVLLVAFALAVAVVPPAGAASVEPIWVDDNPNCQDLIDDGILTGPLQEYKIDDGPFSGTYNLPGGGTVTVETFNSSEGEEYYFNWTSTIGIDAVIVKGGDNANVFKYQPSESFGDDILYPPINPNTGKPFGISHISFCYDTGEPTPIIEVDKICPAFAEAGDLIVYNYSVSNGGDVPLSDVSVYDDQCGEAEYISGDTNQDGKLDIDEIWIFGCAYVPGWEPRLVLTNTATAEGSYEEMTVDDTDSCTLYAFILRKDVQLPDGSPIADDTEFTVKVYRDDVSIATITISESNPAELWLGEGEWCFVEDPVPAGYEPLYDEYCWNTEEDPDVTLINYLTLEPAIALDKICPEFGYAGDTLVYNYSVTNPGNVPLSDVSVYDDQCGEAAYISGDTNQDGKLDTDETWIFGCAYAPDWVFDKNLVNTATAEGWYDEQKVTDDDQCTLYPFRLRKDVALYYDWVHTVPYTDPDTVFTFDLYNGDTNVDTFTITESEPVDFWLSEGTWYFKEVPIPGYETVTDYHWTTGNYPDLTIIDIIEFDLAVEKCGPEIARKGDEVGYAYTVTNAGPASVTPVVTDDKYGSPKYVSGDENDNGKIDPGEVWKYKACLTPEWTFPDPYCNTVTVTDAEYPAEWTPVFGGDSDPSNNTDTFCLYPFVLRKKVFLYWDGTGESVPYAGAEDVPFTVKVQRDGACVKELSITEENPAYLWLSSGTWTFAEVNLPEGYVPGYDAITYTTGTGYPDWTYPNVILFDLALKKCGPAYALPGRTITYTITVTNVGPASVTPVVVDSRCGSPTYVGGDMNRNNRIDPGEGWAYLCCEKVGRDPPQCITNEACVSDAERPSGASWLLGGDSNPENNCDAWTVTIRHTRGTLVPERSPGDSRTRTISMPYR